MGGSGAKRRRQDQRQPSAAVGPTKSTNRASIQVKELPITKKKKSKKPKHLHRKLQQAQDDSVQQELLKKALLELENGKKQKQQLLEKQKESSTLQHDANETILLEHSLPTDNQKETPTRQTAAKSKPIVPKMKPVVTKEATPAPPKNTTKEKEPTSSTKKDANDAHEDDDDGDDDDMELEAPARRQRGKRRRGRQSTSEITESQITEVAPPKSSVETKVASTRPKKRKLKTKVNCGNDDKGNENVTINPDKDMTDKITSSTTTEEDTTKAKRYCHGRKPVTDFVLGQSYPGKVVYVKDFGIFVDINCHIDAFCHVSRLSDEFVASPHNLYKPGDEIPAARIVELERKRITISLQSERMQEQEQASRQARQERKSLRSRKSAHKEAKKVTPSDAATRKVASPAVSATKPVSIKEPTVAPSTDPSNMTPAELKRARKLERRAARRASVGEDVVSQ